ncbi:hypothetical protein QFC20_006709 [Naganishia adeliensis]|uniref:Uncharacterized protein n=1 Tax=Naganishia adeliensis TaxID=92952 RepID=A0ACC2V729_9TREE|nr:hypothetical protein QFC20_006709 [Naganishia adeliensis]
MITWRVRVPADQIIAGKAWKRLVVSPGFKFTRVLVLNTPYTHAYGLKLVSQYLSIQAELCHVRALIVKDADSLAHAEGSRRPFQFEVIRLGSLYSPGTSHVLDVWAGINEGGKGGRAVANVYLPLKITPRDPEDTEGALIPFSPRPDEPVVHLDSVTLDLYHEDQDQKAFESWTGGAVTDTLSFVAYSWGFWGNLSRAGSEADDLPTVDIIGLSIEMAKSSVESASIAGAFASAIRVNSAFAYIIFHVSLEVSRLSTADVQAILAPLSEAYTTAFDELRKQRPNRSTGSVKVSLVTGEAQAVVECHSESGETGICQVTVWGTDGRSRMTPGLQEYLGTKEPLAQGSSMGDSRLLQTMTGLGMLGM